MRFILLLVAAMAAGPAQGAQEQVASTTSHEASARTDPGGEPDIPVSLDRIREELRKTEQQPLLRGLDHEADFKVEIQERAKFDEILKSVGAEVLAIDSIPRNQLGKIQRHELRDKLTAAQKGSAPE